LLALAAQDLVEGGDRDLDLLFCSHRPGTISAWITRDLGKRAPSRSNSNAMPAMMGIAMIRDPIRHHTPGLPKSAKTKIVMTITSRRKLVPQRTCNVG
jgi:hypothetical protein